jgi:hypothetical protein
MEPTVSADPKDYDFFFSYKSETIEVVRPLAELLIASQYKVWFSEYSLDFNVYLSTEEAWRRAALAGISKSKFAICFTNEAYFSSEWCRAELNSIIDCLDSDHILQIPLPMPASYAQVSLSRAEVEQITQLKEKLKSVPCIPYESVPAALRQIERLTKLELDVSFHELGTTTASQRTHFSYNDNDFSLDFSGWRVLRRSTFFNTNGDLPGPSFEREFKEGRISGHILVGPQDKHTTRTLSPDHISRKTTPDRLYYRKAAEFAQVVTHGLWNRAFGNLRHQGIYGLHLLFLLGRSQMAMTTFSRTNETVLFGRGETFTRVYSVVVPEITDDPDTEVAFFFSFQGSFPAFCQCARHMDQLVLSLQREFVSRQSTWQQYRNNLVSWIRQPTLWVTAALLLAADLTLPDLRAALPGGIYGWRSAFLLLMGLIIGCWSSLQSLRVRGFVSSVFLMAVMLVGGFTGSLIVFTLGNKLWRIFSGTPNVLALLLLFGATIVFLGNLIAFLMVTASRRIQNVNIRN